MASRKYSGAPEARHSQPLDSSKHVSRVVGDASVFQQRQELLLECQLFVVFSLVANVGGDLVELRCAHAEGAIAALPLVGEAPFVHESRRVCFEGTNHRCQRDCWGEQEEEVAVVRHASRSQKGDVAVTRDGGNIGIEPFVKIRRDQVFAIFGAEDSMNVVVGIGVAHQYVKNTHTITYLNSLVPRLRRSERFVGTIPSPAGLG